MGEKLLKQSQKYKIKHKNKKRWKKVFSVVACFIVFCVTYALILPAITMEKTSYCTIEAHEHTDACYTETLICGLSEGEEQETHVHDASCYEQEKTLCCTKEETAGHTHTDACKQIEKTLICDKEESEEHIHDDSCYVMTETYICGKEESEGHTHTDACYEMTDKLVCGLEENAEVNGHVHTDACYEQELTCGKEEHEHTLICYSDKSADLETASAWEATLPDELSGVWADDVLAVAKSQLGYKESSKNYDVNAEGRTLGYTRYGAWYGAPYGDWCAMFVSFCLDYAGVDTKKIPLNANCQNWIETLSKEEYALYHSAEEYDPKPGDLIFFDWNGDKKAEHIGLVVEPNLHTENEKTTIQTIEGNASDMVRYVTYEAYDAEILGYASLPEQEEDDVSILRSEQTLTAQIFTDQTYRTSAEDDTVITVSGMLPKGAEVKAYPANVKTENQAVCAYDIAIFLPDGSQYEPGEGEKMNVVIQSEDIIGETSEEGKKFKAFYIPDEGEPEEIDTTTTETGISFETNHFSVYAVMTTSGDMSTVYLNGATGSDDAAGTQTAPVKTFEKAKSLLAENGTIYISGTVTVSGTENWTIDVSGGKIQRASNYTGPLITVANGGDLTLSNITVNGGSGTPSNSNIATNTSYASGSCKAPLIVVDGGGSLMISDGSVLEYNSNKPNVTSAGKFNENGYVGQGGAVYCTGTLIMTGGTIQYCEAESGGGVYVEDGSFSMSGGTIDHNYARDIVSVNLRHGNGNASSFQGYKNAGGGVYVGDNASMQMFGGIISNNQSSREGGGISLGWLNRTWGNAINDYITIFTMTGGTITGNTATSTGGGLNITAGRKATISAGWITNNVANGYEYQDTSNSYGIVFSGGGIYVDASQWNGQGQHSGKPGYLVIHRVIVTANTARDYGGGLASCSTSSSLVSAKINLNDGTAFYNNTAGYSASKEIGINSNNDASISDTVLGGGNYGWTKTSNGIWTQYRNNLTEDSLAIKKAYELYTVMISGNYGYVGGGIGCNGIIEAGGEKEETTSITITKVWDDGNVDSNKVVHPDYIVVQVLQDGEPYGEPIRIYKTTDSDGDEVWPTYYLDGLETGHTYTIAEVIVPGYDSVVSNNGKDYTITNTATGFQVVKKWDGDTEEDRPGFIWVQLYKNGEPYGDAQELTAANKWSYSWNELPETDENGDPYTYTAEEVSVPEGYYCSDKGHLNDNGIWEITNTKIETTTVSAEKRWAEGTTATESVILQLLADGKAYGNPVTLNADNGWFYLWDNLPKYTAENAPDGAEIVYTVEEVTSSGYIVEIEQATPEAAGKIWTPASSLESGKTYLLVSAKGALAGNSSDGLRWMDVSSQLSSGEMPDGSAVWTYNDTLVNGDGKYLVLKSSGDWYNPTYTFGAASSGTEISLDSGHLSASSGLRTRYLTGIAEGYGTTSTSPSNAVSFTLYEQTDASDKWGDVHYIVTNKKATESYTLPETGGMGTNMFTIGGLVLITGSLFMGYIFRRKHERR